LTPFSAAESKNTNIECFTCTNRVNHHSNALTNNAIVISDDMEHPFRPEHLRDDICQTEFDFKTMFWVIFRDSVDHLIHAILLRDTRKDRTFWMITETPRNAIRNVKDWISEWKITENRFSHIPGLKRTEEQRSDHSRCEKGLVEAMLA
jgi:hypothetical protein